MADSPFATFNGREPYAIFDGVGLQAIAGDQVFLGRVTYEPGTTDFFPVMAKVVGGSPDLIVLSGVAPADAPLLIRSALIALTQNTQLGSPKPEDLAATSVNQLGPQGPQIRKDTANTTTLDESQPTAATENVSAELVASAIAPRTQAPDDTKSQRASAPQAA